MAKIVFLPPNMEWVAKTGETDPIIHIRYTALAPACALRIRSAGA